MRRYAWSLVLTCRTEEQLDTFLDGQKSRLVHKSQPELCQVCDRNLDTHTMHYIVYKCNSQTCKLDGRNSKCEWLLKVLSCDVDDVIHIFQHSNHISAAPPSPRPGQLNLSMKRFIRERAAAGDKPAKAMNTLVSTFKIHVPNAKQFLSQVQYIVRSFRNKVLHDNDYIDEMVQLASVHRFRDDIPDTHAFAYGFDTDGNGIPVLGEATEDSPLVVGFATKLSILRIEHASSFMLHLDATFKLNTKGYPVIVIGLSDYWRQFHPICFFLVSDLKQPQWQAAIRSTLELYQKISGRPARIRFVMMDADTAQRNAFEAEALRILEVDYQPCYLMCFFHVMQNVRKHSLKLAPENKQLIYRHVYRIHYSRGHVDKQVKIKEALKAWEINAECRCFSDYFVQQWVTGRFNKWQCFETPTGLAKTNNPVENFNRQLKNQHTMRRLLRLNPLFLELLKVANVRSLLAKDLEPSPRAAPHVLREYRKLVANNLLQVISATSTQQNHESAMVSPSTYIPAAHRSSIAFITSSADADDVATSPDHTNSPVSALREGIIDGVGDNTSLIHSIDHTVPSMDVCFVLQRQHVEDTALHSTNDSSAHPLTKRKAEMEEDRTDQQLEMSEQPSYGWSVTVTSQSCFCRTWFKLGCCVHVMAALNAQGLPYDGSPPPRPTFPDKRPHKKRGRPTKVGHALSLQ